MSKSCQQLPTIWSVPDELWDEIKPLLKIKIPKKKPGRPRADDRRILNGLIYLARTGCQWCALPREFGPKSTVYERFREWLSQGCLEKVWVFLLEKYDGTIGIAWEWCAADGCIIKAPLGKRGIEGESEATGSNPTDRGKSGSKRHLLTDQKGIPLSVVVSGANRHDMKKLDDLLEATKLYPPLDVRQHLCLEQPPAALRSRGYDYAECRILLEDFGYIAHIPDTSKPVPAPGDPLRHQPKRWIVEVSLSWFNRFRRLLIRWEKLSLCYLGFVQLAACLIISRKLISNSPLLS